MRRIKSGSNVVSLGSFWKVAPKSIGANVTFDNKGRQNLFDIVMLAYTL